MKTKPFNIYDFGNGFYRSIKISVEELVKLCAGCNCPYFMINIKEKDRETPDGLKKELVFWLSTDIRKKENEKINEK